MGQCWIHFKWVGCFFKSSWVFLCTFKGSATQPVKTAIMSSVALTELSNVGVNNHWWWHYGYLALRLEITKLALQFGIVHFQKPSLVVGRVKEAIQLHCRKCSRGLKVEIYYIYISLLRPPTIYNYRQSIFLLYIYIYWYITVWDILLQSAIPSIFNILSNG